MGIVGCGLFVDFVFGLVEEGWGFFVGSFCFVVGWYGVVVVVVCWMDGMVWNSCLVVVRGWSLSKLDVEIGKREVFGVIWLMLR